MTKRTAPPAAAGAALPEATEPSPVQTPAPAAAEWPRDQYTGIGGDYIRDPITGVRTPVPPAAPAAGDTAAA